MPRATFSESPVGRSAIAATSWFPSPLKSAAITSMAGTAMVVLNTNVPSPRPLMTARPLPLADTVATAASGSPSLVKSATATAVAAALPGIAEPTRGPSRPCPVPRSTPRPGVAGSATRASGRPSVVTSATSRSVRTTPAG
ncbi:MAG: hypothetical protein M3513_13015 [Actinomycetota bacterium]|nr:hypothetical protein [Actinomycetota bacterium]